ncbi:MAG: AmmeMemoRadiSam system protein B, partial [Planctomycetota bacterium]
AEVEDPEIEGTVVGIVAPHLDYERGWPNYAAAYECLRRMDAPDRVVILGTNHFGIGDGVVLSEYGFATPLGISAVDQLVVEKLKERHGKALTIDSLDHVGEHSIELQLPWMQHCFGTDVPIVAALVPSPLAEPIEDNDDRVAASTFIKDLNDIVAEVGGTTFFIASSDLSHVGPQFGEPRPVDDQRRFDVERHDREMMAKFIEGDAEAFVEAFKWNQNPTGWCSIGNMAATLNLAQPGTIELIDYRQVSDEAGNVMVSSAAMVLVK